jgi:hypothetical protein
VPYLAGSLRAELRWFVLWYNRERPHDFLDGATPEEIYRGVVPRCRQPRFEPRRRWPRDAPCAAPAAEIRGHSGTRIDLQVSYLAGRKHLPVVSLRRVA